MQRRRIGLHMNIAGAVMRIGTICLASILLAVPPAQAADLGTLDGTWDGTLSAVDRSQQIASYGVRIVIAGANAHVFTLYANGIFQEVKPGKFHVSRLGPNGIVAAIDSGQDNEGTWVETWNYTVTLKQKDTLIVNFCGTVNNVDLPLTSDHSKFAEVDAGELKRT